MEYPKINSLYKRQFTSVDPSTGKMEFLDKGKSGNPLIIGEYACPEFAAIKHWTITEKVDGTNIRVILDRLGEPQISFGGRTAKAQLPTSLLRHLQTTFTIEKMDGVFKESNYTVLFGEGYGPKIQSGGNYRSDVSFILFDVFCSGWWLEYEDVMIIADKLGIEHAPILSKSNVYEEWTADEIVEFVKSKPVSAVAQTDKYIMEGVIARSYPQMMFRKGGPIMFKLKCRDFENV